MKILSKSYTANVLLVFKDTNIKYKFMTNVVYKKGCGKYWPIIVTGKTVVFRLYKSEKDKGQITTFVKKIKKLNEKYKAKISVNIEYVEVSTENRTKSFKKNFSLAKRK